MTCSPFSSPLHDITNDQTTRHSLEKDEIITNKQDECIIISDSGHNVPSSFSNKVQIGKGKENFIRYDDDVTIIDTKPEIIALSSDDEDDVSIDSLLNDQLTPLNQKLYRFKQRVYVIFKLEPPAL